MTSGRSECHRKSHVRLGCSSGNKLPLENATQPAPWNLRGGRDWLGDDLFASNNATVPAGRGFRCYAQPVPWVGLLQPFRWRFSMGRNLEGTTEHSFFLLFSALLTSSRCRAASQPTANLPPQPDDTHLVSR